MVKDILKTESQNGYKFSISNVGSLIKVCH